MCKYEQVIQHWCTHIIQVLQTLMPLRYDFQKMGGSWAQRQVMNLTMIQAAINNNDLLVAFQLVAELKVHGCMW